MSINSTNYHCHTIFCDGRVTMETMVKFATAEGFTSFGISSHAPLPFQTKWTMNKEDVADYFAEYYRLKGKYANKLDLYIGMEIDYLDEENNPANSYFQQLPLDYRIGSVHMVPDLNEKLVDIDCDVKDLKYIIMQRFNGNIKYLMHIYMYQQIKMIEQGGFDVVGHLNKLFYNISLISPDILQKEWMKKMIDNLFSLIAGKKYMIEINTKKYRKEGVFFPDEHYFKQLLQLGIPVQVNSDAHYPDLINDGRPEALAALKKAGFKTVRQLEAGHWRDIEIV